MHFAKRDFRFTPYLIGYLLKIESIKLFYLQYILVWPFIFFSLLTFKRFTKDPLISTLATLSIMSLYVGLSFSYDVMFLDSLGYLGLLVSLYYFKKPIIIPILLLTFFVDERAVIGSLFLPIFYQNEISQGKNASSFLSYISLFFKKNVTFLYLSIALIAYVLIRFALQSTMNVGTPIGYEVGVQLFASVRLGFNIIPAIFSVYKFHLVLIFLTSSMLLSRKKGHLVICTLLVFLLTFLAGTAVYDVTRSLSYGFLIFFLVFYLIADHAGWNRKIYLPWLFLLTISNILTVTYTSLYKLERIEKFTWIFESVAR
jgi:hypothetical protein